jgi:hypothetical protein
MFPLLNPDKTFVASFADHRYDWGSQDKYRISEGMAQWIASKGSPPTLKQIIVVGHSRGGCLALSIVAWLRASSAFNNVRILAVPVDPTCEIGEMGTSTANIDNPQSGDAEGYAWRSSFSLNNSNQVCIHNIVNGHSNWSPPLHNIHNVYLNSWKNTWSAIPHVTLGTCFENNVREKCEPFGNNLVRQEVLDRALRFIGLNLVP